MIVAPRHLLSGLRRQLENDATPAVREIVRHVLAERPAVRILDRTLQSLSGTGVPSWFAALNGARCRVRLRSSGPGGGVLACLRRPNERRAGEWLRHELGDVPWADVRFDLRAAHRALGKARHTGTQLRRTARFARTMGETEDAFHVLRAVELLAYYAALGELLDSGRHRAAVTSSYSNPWGIALNLAARARGVPVAHVMHGVALDPVPRLDHDALILNDPASAEVFRRAGCRIGTTIVKSAGAEVTSPRAIPKGGVAVGVLLSKETAHDHLHRLIAGLLRRSDVASIAIRPHPSGVGAATVASLAARASGRVVISSGPLRDDLARADVIVAGRSSVHIEALLSGVPSIHDPAIDSSAAAGLTFLSDGTVFVSDDAARADFARASGFYARPEWRERLRRHGNVIESPGEVRGQLRALFSRWLAEGNP